MEHNLKACINCGKKNIIKSKLCDSCGASLILMMICPHCRLNIEFDAEFCNYCGIRIEDEIKKQVSEYGTRLMREPGYEYRCKDTTVQR